MKTISPLYVETTSRTVRQILSSYLLSQHTNFIHSATLETTIVLVFKVLEYRSPEARRHERSRQAALTLLSQFLDEQQRRSLTSHIPQVCHLRLLLFVRCNYISTSLRSFPLPLSFFALATETRRNLRWGRSSYQLRFLSPFCFF